MATPGHSAGSVCYLINGRVWGATETEEKEKTDALIQIIKTKLLALPENTLILPGHEELTDIGHEKPYNPYLK